jgi:putative ABC transport system permease protein
MLKNYLKLALKVLLRRKFFTFVSLFGVAFTLLVLLLATSILDHLFTARGVEAKFDRTLVVGSVRLINDRGVMQTPAGYRFLDRYVRKMQTPETVSAYMREQKVASYQGDSKREVYLKRTDGEYWKILDFEFVEGGPYTAADERKASFVAVINESTRRMFFGGERALGKRIEVDGQRFRVAGVVRDVSYLQPAAFSDVWVPISTLRSTAYRDEITGNFTGLLLARSRADLPKMRREFEALLPAVERPKEWDRFESMATTRFEGMAREMPTRSVWAARLLFIVAAVLFMTLPAVNLINLNLSRILERAPEIGVRKAFGASTSSLVGQFVVENVVLTLIGGVIGLALTAVLLSAINGMDLIPYAQMRINLRIFGYAMVLAVVFGLFSGVYPAWRMSRLHPVQALRGGSR